MHTTIRMNEEIARRAKAYAAKTSRTFTQLVEEAVVSFMSENAQKKSPRKRIVLPTFGDPKQRISEDEYREMIEKMYDDEARHVLKNGF